MIIDTMVKNDEIVKEAGYGSADKFLGQKIPVSNMHSLTIVGISDRQNPCIYMDRSLFINVLSNTEAYENDGSGTEDMDLIYGGGMDVEQEFTGTFIDYGLMKKKVELKKGDWPEKRL